MESARLQDAHRFARSGAAACVLLILIGGPRRASAAEWRDDPRFAEAEAGIREWLRRLPAGAKDAVAQWEAAVLAAPRPARLGAPLLRIAASSDERLASLLSELPEAPPAWLADLGPVGRALRLAFAERFATHERHEATLAWLDGLEASDAYSPALLHYLRAVALRLTVDDAAAKDSIEGLHATLESAGAGRLGDARRWIAGQLQRDQKQPSEPLETVSRRMRDVERRLKLADGGDETQRRQQAVLDELDKLIEQLEEQRKKQQQQAASSSQGAQPGSPAEESRPSELKGPGEVDRKRLVAGDDWGALPPAERERLTQAITRDFPPHYRSLIEDYFRTLASEADRAAPADSADASR